MPIKKLSYSKKILNSIIKYKTTSTPLLKCLNYIYFELE